MDSVKGGKKAHTGLCFNEIALMILLQWPIGHSFCLIKFCIHYRIGSCVPVEATQPSISNIIKNMHFLKKNCNRKQGYTAISKSNRTFAILWSKMAFFKRPWPIIKPLPRLWSIQIPIKGD